MWDPPLTSLNFKVGKLKSPSPQFLSNLSILKSLFFPLDLSENTDINNIPESMDKDTTDSEADEFQGSAENAVMDNDDMFALEEIYESKDDDENDHYCDEFRDEHDNWALMFELVRD
ncbi:uncharacterized protein LOC125666415 [Ostrea edulis]|uniref:uncharacterized protein LOC125666415 n=1 Tax=Ostrea edulis TaxID=37623 RepID=UPI0024AF056B|nr:uncharacterized protein LOC125666415 [Ostrea edulis]